MMSEYITALLKKKTDEGSWSRIANTKGRSEESQRDILRSTSAYHVLSSITHNPSE